MDYYGKVYSGGMSHIYGVCWAAKICDYLDALQVNGVHDRSLKKLDGREMTFEQTLQLQVGWLSVRRGCEFANVCQSICGSM